MPKQPDRLKINTDWESAAAKAMDKKKPAAGWPKPDPVPQRAPKTKRPKK